MSIDEISRLVCDTLEKNPISLSLSTWPILLPTLGVSYQREYLESSHNIRLTIDTKISFSNAAGVKKLKHLPFSLFPKYVVEFKYLVRNKDDLSKILNTFPFRAVRSSKYVLGSAMHGHVNYI